MEYTKTAALLPTYFRKAYAGEIEPVHTSGFSRLLTSSRITALHHHQEMELGICLYGEGITYVSNRIYHFHTGDLQIVRPEEPHLSATKEGTESAWIWISLDPFRLLLSLGITDVAKIRRMLKEGFSGVFTPKEHPTLARLLHKLHEGTKDGRQMEEWEAAFLVGELLYECQRIGAIDEGTPGDNTPERLGPTIAYISEHYADPEAMREEAIAAKAGVSPSYLRLLFQKHAGISPKAFVIRIRLAAAEHLLRTEDTAVLEVALRCGFGQISCFNRTFRRAFGMTPSEYRRKNRK